MKLMKSLIFISLIIFSKSIFAAPPEIKKAYEFAAMIQDDKNDYIAEIVAHIKTLSGDDKADFLAELAAAAKQTTASGKPLMTKESIAKITDDLIKNRVDIWNTMGGLGIAAWLYFDGLIKKQKDLLEQLSKLGQTKTDIQIYNGACKYFATHDAAAQAEVETLLKNTTSWHQAAGIAKAKMETYYNNEIDKLDKSSPQYLYQVEKIKCMKQMIFDAVNKKQAVGFAEVAPKEALLKQLSDLVEYPNK